MKSFNLIEYGQFVPHAQKAEDIIRVPLSERGPGIHQIADFFFRITSDHVVDWVVSRSCDHAQGKLSLKDECFAQCPLHNWILDLDSLTYKGVNVSKKRLPFKVVDDMLEIKKTDMSLRLDLPEAPSDIDMRIRFLAHASVAISGDDLTIVTDPWLIGPCFSTGWWHAFPPKMDVLDVLRRADAVYISHNHPDHLHLETLQYLPREMPMIVPDFESGSVKSILLAEGFKDIRALPFNKTFRINDSGVVISLFQAGDFRDDSGLFMQVGKTSTLWAVDANRLNDYVLPRPVDFVGTSFASGASGFPLCFTMLSETEQNNIVIRNRNALVAAVVEYVRATDARHYMPYAGYFTEAAPRDAEIKRRNRKNSPSDIAHSLNARFPEVRFFDPTEHDTIVVNDGKFTSENSRALRSEGISELSISSYISQQVNAGASCTTRHIVHYFEQSDFHDALILYLQPTNDEFGPDGDGFKIIFGADAPVVISLDCIELADEYENVSDQPKVNTKFIRIRRHALQEAIVKGLPWENLSIGFQCRVHRKPNVYNVGFWFHFTNIYIGNVVLSRQLS
jgi:CMP-N-acetylneuraminate monooxygenase